MRTFRVPAGLILAVTCATALLVGCSSTTGGQPTTAVTTMSSAVTSAAATSDLGHGLVIATPAGTSATPFATSDYGNCTGVEAKVITDAGEYQLWLVGKDCADAAQRALNGNHGRYLNPPTSAQDVTESTTVPTGTLVTFHQLYTECTNSCDDYHDAVGLITLSKPADPDLPVLMIVAPKDADGDLTTVTALANAITQG